MSLSNPKKRKRVEDEEESEESSTKIALWTNPSSSIQLGPTLASFLSVKPPMGTPFSCYSNENDPSADYATANTVFAGETQAIRYVSNNKDKRDPGYHCRYLVGIRNKVTNQIHVRPAPLYLVGHHVKALESANTASQAVQDYAQARNQLGEAFGTKKARAAIRAMERNQVDVGAMAGVSDVLQEMIGHKTNALPQKEEAESIAHNHRPIPRYNENATSPAEVYPVDAIVPDAELAVISVDMVSVASLPFKKSAWVNSHVKRRAGKPTKSERLELKLLFYVSAMFFFRRALFKNMERSELRDKLSPLPDIIADSLISRFTEVTRGSSKVQATLHKETELLTHALALCLRIDRFACDPRTLAADLGMPLSSVQRLFKSLGCVMAIPTKAEQLELGLGSEDAKQAKLAILRLPLKFPAASKGRR